MVKKSKGISFEDKLGKLEEIVKKLESEDTPIEESIKIFGEGVEISKELSKKLDEIKGKLEVLKKDAKGNLSLESYNEE